MSAEPKGTRRWSNLTFILLFLVVIVLFLTVIGPFLLPVLVAAFVVALLYPANDWLTKKLGGRRRVAAFFSTLSIFLLLVVPLAGLVYLFVNQAIDLIAKIEEALGPDGFGSILKGEMPEVLQPLLQRFERFQIGEQVRGALSGLAAALARSAAGLVGATANLVIALFLAFVSLYYFFADGHRIVEGILEALPLERRYSQRFLLEVRNVSQTMIGVNLATGLIQGVLGAIGFVIVGLPSPVVWAALMALFSFVPVVGTGAIWVPAGIVLLVTGRIGAGLFLLGWGVVVVGSADNFLRPFLAKGRMDLHPLLVFLTIFGGLAAFGFLGVILGPMIGSIFTAMVRIWKEDFVPRLVG